MSPDLRNCYIEILVRVDVPVQVGEPVWGADGATLVGVALDPGGEGDEVRCLVDTDEHPIHAVCLDNEAIRVKGRPA